MVPEEILDDQNQDQEQEQGQEQEPNNSESEDITQAYAAKDWHSGELITSDSLDRIEIELSRCIWVCSCSTTIRRRHY